MFFKRFFLIFLQRETIKLFLKSLNSEFFYFRKFELDETYFTINPLDYLKLNYLY